MITGKTNVVGLIGDPIEHSLSPLMHNAAFLELGLDYVYVPYRVSKEDLETSIKGAQSLNIKGLNVTIPHKTAIIKFLDELDRSSQLIGAVNTVKFEDNIIKGYNTDGIGLVRALEEVTSIKNKRVVITGAGGAARAAAFQILLEGAGSMVIANRTVNNAITLRDDILNNFKGDVEAVDLGQLKTELKDVDILIDTTPLGMYPNIDENPVITAEYMHSNLTVFDMVYNPLKTSLLIEADKAGAKSVSGIKMLIYQGIESFQIWTGIKPSVMSFQNSLKDKL
ncbi:MAG: shikimate dehydrogenase [Methanobacteriaceae archaeon]|jgi:shikimate dehydrogenase|nr:MAG: shikimate dehydrogenase [Methanobacterium sp. BRmetb2]MCC7557655.1 shikimate dehydrogenase [Methanobacteriaceae archaeon]